MHPNWPVAVFIVRWILGLLFLIAGYWKVFVLTPANHAEQFFLLQQPLYDIDGHTFTRLALINFLLCAPLESDRYSLEALCLTRRST